MEMSTGQIAEMISGIVICIGMAAMCLSTFIVYRNHGCSFMVTILIMLIISSMVRMVERFNYIDELIDKESKYHGAMVGVEISIAWICCLIAEWFTAMKFFDVSS